MIIWRWTVRVCLQERGLMMNRGICASWMRCIGCQRGSFAIIVVIACIVQVYLGWICEMRVLLPSLVYRIGRCGRHIELAVPSIISTTAVWIMLLLLVAIVVAIPAVLRHGFMAVSRVAFWAPELGLKSA